MSESPVRLGQFPESVKHLSVVVQCFVHVLVDSPASFEMIGWIFDLWAHLDASYVGAYCWWAFGIDVPFRQQYLCLLGRQS